MHVHRLQPAPAYMSPVAFESQTLRAPVAAAQSSSVQHLGGRDCHLAGNPTEALPPLASTMQCILDSANLIQLSLNTHCSRTEETERHGRSIHVCET